MTTNRQKEVGKDKQRKHTLAIAKLWLGRKTMAKQAKTLNQQELRRVLDYTATRKHSTRNRVLVLVSFLSGMRVGEIASLRYSDVVSADGTIKNEIYLTAEQTKGSEGRTVFVSDRLRKELESYIVIYKPINTNRKFFYSQKSTSDGSSTICINEQALMEQVAIVGVDHLLQISQAKVLALECYRSYWDIRTFKLLLCISTLVMICCVRQLN
jgi:integrase